MTTRSRQAGAAGIWVLVILIVLAIAAFVAWRWYSRAPAPTTVAAPASAPAAPSTAPRYPIAAIAATDDQPAAAASVAGEKSLDPRAALQALPGAAALSGLLQSTDVIPRIVATVDALPHRSLSAKVLPLQPPGGAFRVDKGAEGVVVGTANAARYAPYLALLDDVDLPAAVAWYAHNYPTFEQAYRRLGYPEGHFNDRLVAVIDHLLAAPDPTTPPQLVAHKGGWVYADEHLQSLSAGQRILLRLPPDERTRVDARLRQLRALVTARAASAVAPASSAAP